MKKLIDTNYVDWKMFVAFMKAVKVDEYGVIHGVEDGLREAIAAAPEVAGGATRRAALWVVSGDTGSSSMSIFAHMMVGVAPERGASPPMDVSDLGRCLRLLDRVQEWKPRMPEMARYGARWAALVAHWNELETLYREELGGRTAPKTYARMKSIFQEAENENRTAKGHQ